MLAPGIYTHHNTIAIDRGHNVCIFKVDMVEVRVSLFSYSHILAFFEIIQNVYNLHIVCLFPYIYSN